MNQIAIMESKIEVLCKQLDDKDKELRAVKLAHAVEKDIMQTNFDQCKSAAEYWNKKYDEMVDHKRWGRTSNRTVGDTFGQETRLAEKLNQVIENQNKIIDYLNQLEKEILDEWLRKYNTLCIAD